jgi:hypothetical protein
LALHLVQRHCTRLEEVRCRSRRHYVMTLFIMKETESTRWILEIRSKWNAKRVVSRKFWRKTPSQEIATWPGWICVGEFAGNTSFWPKVLKTTRETKVRKI